MKTVITIIISLLMCGSAFAGCEIGCAAEDMIPEYKASPDVSVQYFSDGNAFVLVSKHKASDTAFITLSSGGTIYSKTDANWKGSPAANATSINNISEVFPGVATCTGLAQTTCANTSGCTWDASTTQCGGTPDSIVIPDGYAPVDI